MKKFITLIFLLMIIPSICFAALSASTVWEYEADATAGNLNGGGFVAGTGTDYTQFPTCKASWTVAAAGCAQASPVNSTNDLASAGDWLTVTSAAGGFTDAMVGNLIHITAATGSVTAGWYQILTRADTNTITVDRATGTGDWTAGTGYVGGALSLPTSASLTAMVAGNTAWVKYGTYTFATNATIGTPGTNAAWINLTGYKSIRGDTPIGTDRPTFTFGANYLATRSCWAISNLILLGTGAYYVVVNAYDGGSYYNCKISGSQAGGTALYINAYYFNVINCELSQTGGTAFVLDHGYGLIYGNYIHDSSVGFNMHDANNTTIAFNIFANNSTSAIYFDYENSQNFLINNTFYGGETPTGIGLNAVLSHRFILYGNIFYGFVTGASMTTAYLDCFVDYNDWYNNTADVSNFTKGAHDIALNPNFVSAATGDFRIGTNLKGKGFPGSFANVGASANCIGYMDIGAVQRVEPSMGVAW